MSLSFKPLLMIGLGGGAGAILRYVLGTAVHRLLTPTSMPWGTLAVNLVGCFLIGLALGHEGPRNRLTPEVHALLVIGLLGGFTTFSAFGYETVTLARTGSLYGAGVNVMLQVGLGMVAVLLGIGSSQMW